MVDLIDHGFAPLRSRFDRYAFRYLKRRPNTTVQPANRRARKRMRTLSDFVNHLDDPDVEFPVGRLMLVNHANAEGWMQVRIDRSRAARGGTSFEAVVNAIDEASVTLPSGLFEDSGKDPVFRIVGCNVGRATVYVDKLREALGGEVHVVAPRFLNGIKPHAKGNFEFLAYSLTMVSTSRKKLRRRSQVVDAFAELEHHYYDNQVMPAELIEQWIPRKVRRKETKLKKVVGARPALGRSVNRQTKLPVPVLFQVKQRSFLGRGSYTMTYPCGVSAPRDRAEQLAAIQEVVAGQAGFQDDHEFPVYERFGYESLDEFMDGWYWKIKRSRRKLSAKPMRFEYRIIVPVVDIDEGVLLYDYVPTKPARSDTEALKLLPEDNPHLFYTSK